MKRGEGSLSELSDSLADFARQRDWEQFHSPKNLSMALIAEAAELVEHFQWLTEEQSKNIDAEKKQAVSLELADILIYLIRTAERLDIDLIEATWKKIDINNQRFPVETVHDDARRTSECDKD